MQPGVHTITLSVETDSDSWECWHGMAASICKTRQTSTKSAVASSHIGLPTPDTALYVVNHNAGQTWGLLDKLTPVGAPAAVHAAHK